MNKKICHNDPHSPITCGQIFGDSDDSGLFWAYVGDTPLGCTTDPVQTLDREVLAVKWPVSRVAFAPSPFILSLIPFFIGCRGFPRS